MANKIIAVDFDGTLCENIFPEIGQPNQELIDYLQTRKKDGDRLILWTCRVGENLNKAVKWAGEHGLIFDAINKNLPDVIERFGSDTRKIFANKYIDDKNILVSFCRLGLKIGAEMCQSERAELFGCLVDIVEDWLQEKGITVDDIPNAERVNSEGAAIIYGNDYDYLADRFAATLGISRDCPDAVKKEEKTELQSWAEREIEIACKHERGDSGSKDGEWDYGCACYESALKAYKI